MSLDQMTVKALRELADGDDVPQLTKAQLIARIEANSEYRGKGDGQTTCWYCAKRLPKKVLASFVRGYPYKHCDGCLPAPAPPPLRIERGEGWEMRLGLWQDSPPELVDVTISDPPYGTRTHTNGRRGTGWKGVAADNRVISERAPKSFDPIDPADIAPWLVGLTRRWVVCFCEIEQIGEYAAATGDMWVRGGMAPKSNPTPQFTGDRPGTPGDCIAIMHRAGRKRWNGGGHAAFWQWYSEKVDRVHETQKPLDLMLRLVELFTDPGELVWDPYAGSATTGVACLHRGRRFIGHEMQERYFDVACERLRAAEKGQSLSAARAGQDVLL